MKKLVVGDLHGQVKIAKRALMTGYPVIFMGDYVDSFTRGADMSAETLLTVVEAVEAGKATALWGNHDLQYFNEAHRSGGYNIATEALLLAIGGYRIDRALQFYHMDEGFLFTHAGITNSILLDKGITWQEFLKDNRNFHSVGRARGGFGLPGLIWCDWNREFEPVPGLKQIVGHTRGNIIREKDGNYCVDVLEDRDPQGLLVENGEVEILNF